MYIVMRLLREENWYLHSAVLYDLTDTYIAPFYMIGLILTLRRLIWYDWTDTYIAPSYMIGLYYCLVFLISYHIAVLC